MIKAGMLRTGFTGPDSKPSFPLPDPMPPFRRPDVTGTGLTWGESPRWHGVPARSICRGRAVLGGGWASVPEQCDDNTGSGIWVAGGRVLVCRRCGLDST